MNSNTVYPGGPASIHKALQEAITRASLERGMSPIACFQFFSNGTSEISAAQLQSGLGRLQVECSAQEVRLILGGQQSLCFDDFCALALTHLPVKVGCCCSELPNISEGDSLIRSFQLISQAKTADVLAIEEAAQNVMDAVAERKPDCYRKELKPMQIRAALHNPMVMGFFILNAIGYCLLAFWDRPFFCTGMVGNQSTELYTYPDTCHPSDHDSRLISPELAFFLPVILASSCAQAYVKG